MNLIEKMQFMNFQFGQYVEYYDFIQQLLLNKETSNYQKYILLNSLYDMSVFTTTISEDELLKDSRESLMNQIVQLRSEKQSRGR